MQNNEYRIDIVRIPEDIKIVLDVYFVGVTMEAKYKAIKLIITKTLDSINRFLYSNEDEVIEYSDLNEILSALLSDFNDTKLASMLEFDTPDDAIEDIRDKMTKVIALWVNEYPFISDIVTTRTWHVDSVSEDYFKLMSKQMNYRV